MDHTSSGSLPSLLILSPTSTMTLLAQPHHPTPSLSTPIHPPLAHWASHQQLSNTSSQRGSCRAFQQPSVQDRVLLGQTTCRGRTREETHTWFLVLQKPTDLLPRRTIVQYLCSILTSTFWNIQVSLPITRINSYAILKQIFLEHLLVLLFLSLFSVLSNS